MSETILITGGASFIGSHVAAALVGCGYQVVVLDDLGGDCDEGLAMVCGTVGERPGCSDSWRNPCPQRS